MAKKEVTVFTVKFLISEEDYAQSTEEDLDKLVDQLESAVGITLQNVLDTYLEEKLPHVKAEVIF